MVIAAFRSLERGKFEQAGHPLTEEDATALLHKSDAVDAVAMGDGQLSS